MGCDGRPYVGGVSWGVVPFPSFQGTVPSEAVIPEPPVNPAVMWRIEKMRRGNWRRMTDWRSRD